MKNQGQVLVGALALLVILAIAIPPLINYTQQDGIWTQKEQRSTRSFQLAESAVEQGYQQLILSSTTWSDVINGQHPAGFSFDKTYNAGSGNEYEINFVSGPGSNQLTIYGVGRASGSNDIRGVKAIYSTSGVGTNAITAGKLVTIGASVEVEWGGVISYTSIDSGGRAHPRFYSSGSIDLDTNGSTPPNSDNKQWWSYQTNLPPQVQVDLQYYKAQAQSYVTAPPAGCPAYYSNPGSGTNTNVTGCNDTSGKTFYFETGDWTFKSPGLNYIVGNVILANGNIGISGNGGAGGSYLANIPPQAWEEYANDWAAYQAMDTFANGAFPTFAAADAAGYSSSATYGLTDILVHGFVYAGGGSGLTGGGNSKFHGVVITPNTVTIATSNHTIYFDNSTATSLRTLSTTMSRISWQDVANCSWGSGHATCP